MKAPPYDQSSLWKMASPFIEDPTAGAQIMRGVLTLLSSVFHSFPCQNHFSVFLYTDIILYQRLIETLWPCTCGGLLITYESTTLK